MVKQKQQLKNTKKKYYNSLKKNGYKGNILFMRLRLY